ncbi:MAG: flagellar motor switch protein FliN [Gammaproteobacteria bacterium]|jgi:flagellar motor switch protein FliN/FliY
MDNETPTPNSPADGTSTAARTVTEKGGATARAELENLEATGSPPATVADGARRAAADGSRPSLDIVLDVPVTVSLEVGRTTMSVGELLKLGQGAVVELDRAVGEPLDVMVNGILVARGEIVLVNETFGIRLTSIIERAETMSAVQASDQ